MQVVQVNLVNSQALQTLLARLLNILWVARNGLVPSPRDAELGGEEDLVTLASTLEPVGRGGQSYPFCTCYNTSDISPLPNQIFGIHVYVCRIPVGASRVVYSVEQLRGVSSMSDDVTTYRRTQARTHLEALLVALNLAIEGRDAHCTVADGRNVCVSNLARRKGHGMGAAMLVR